MKNSSDLENALRSSVIAAGGFLGTDSRNLDEIISSDLAELSKSGVTVAKLVERMKVITAAATASLGSEAKIEKKYLTKVEEAKGCLTCPWPDSCRFAKRITSVKNTETGKIARWTDLNIHLIEQHNFFEGKGSAYRIEPEEIVKVLF